MVSCGEYPAKAVVGEVVAVRATVWREGHEAVAATLVVRYHGPHYPQLVSAPAGLVLPDAPAPQPGTDRVKPLSVPMVAGGQPDTFEALFTPDAVGLWTFRVDGWGDPVTGWRAAVTAKLAAGQSEAELDNDLLVGATLLDRAAAGVPRGSREPLLAAATALRTPGDPYTRSALALSEQVAELLRRHPLRELVTRGKRFGVWVDRPAARFSAWYEMFPRSTGGRDDAGNPVHGSFATAAAALERVAQMGFDVVYLPPIHPIGKVHRKGRNNSVTAVADDVGSPWAIGSDEGGHDAVHPQLGTIDDFDDFVATAAGLGMEVALDLALQCAPDHPWAKEHRQWFTELPDGTIAYAENPPKKYQDIYPLNFDNDPAGLYGEVLRVVLHWVSHGVKIFRVDNPHTKPPNFWAWLIAEVKDRHPEVLFLSEAFTRPARLYGLARLGFTQSYSYFTWRTAKWEITEFGEQIAEHSYEARPNLFVNTPDILHASLQHGGPGMFAIRAALAATLSPLWGVYSGFELYEYQPLREDSEEYLDSEKYQLRHWNHDDPGSLAPFITRINRIRRENPALQQDGSLRFLPVDNDQLLAYAKTSEDGSNVIVTVVNLDPHQAHSGWLQLDPASIQVDPQQAFQMHDLLSNQRFSWRGAHHYVRLDPHSVPAHVFAVRRRLRDERDFDYYL